MDVEYVYRKYKVDKNALKRVQTLNGSIELFCSRYIDTLVGKNNMKLYSDMNGGIINHFDLSSPYTVGDYSGYSMLLIDILKIKPGFITHVPIEDTMQSVIDNILSKEEILILNNEYRLDGKKVATADFCDRLNIDKKTYDKILRKSIKKLQSNVKNTKLQSLQREIVDSSIVADVITKMLEAEDVFYSGKIEGISEKKLKLTYLVLEREIKGITYGGDSRYVENYLVTKKRINKSILSQTEKNKLTQLLEDKKIKISTNHRKQIIASFEKELNANIDKRIETYDCIIKKIRNSGLDEVAIQKLMSMVPEQESVEEEKFGSFKKRIISNIGFPHLDLKLDDMLISDGAKESMRNAGFYCVADVIVFNQQELLRFGNIEKSYAKEVLKELERIGYDISGESDLTIEEYNQDKMSQDNYLEIANEINNSNYKDYLKSSLLNILVSKTIDRLKSEYEKYENAIAMYKDIVRTHERYMRENTNIIIYNKRIEEAESKKKEIDEKLGLFEK